MTMTGGQMLAAALERHGVDALFMIPGVQLDWAVDALARSKQIRLFVPRHEQTTTYMADGYHRISGKPGVAMVVPGPGVLNAGAGLATAYSTNSKVLLISGQIHSSAIGGGLGLLHEIKDQSAVIAALTKWHRCVRNANDIGGAVDQAFAHMHAGRPRPTAIEVAHDLLKAKGDLSAASADAEAIATPQATQAELDRAAAMIDAARFPILFVGGGVLSDATQSLRQFAEKIGAPVVMSDNGRGALSDRHPLAMSTLAGRTLFPHADVVIVVGSRFIDSMDPAMAWPDPGPKYIFINIDRADFSAPRVPALCLHADARSALDALCASVKCRTVITSSDALRVKAWAQTQIDAVTPQIDYVRAMRAALPEDGIFVNELTQVGYLARIAYPVYEPRTYITHGYQGTLGYGFPTALGAAVAANSGTAGASGAGRRVLSITGDGGFGWNLQELATAHKYQLPVTLVVFKDGYFGNVRAIQQRLFGTEVAVKLDNPDFVALAKAFSVPATRVDSPASLGAAIRSSLSEHGPVLIEVAVNEMPSPWHLLRLKAMEGVNISAAPPDPLVSIKS